MTDILTKLAALTQTPRCHRSACRSQDAHWWNPSTREYYCQECALRINDAAGYALCISPVNMPPQYSAHIALVREAAGEIERLEKQFCILGEAVCSYDKRITEYFYKISTLEWAIGCKDKRILQFSEAINEQEVEIERIRKGAQNLIDAFKIGDDIVKDGVPKYVANAIATTALHQLNQALNPQEQPDA